VSYSVTVYSRLICINDDAIVGGVDGNVAVLYETEYPIFAEAEEMLQGAGWRVVSGSEWITLPEGSIFQNKIERIPSDAEA
jgi:hypothetical protein